MTDVVEIGTGNVSDAFQLAQTIRFAGATAGFIVEASAVELSTKHSALTTADGEFEKTGDSGLDVTINHGEAYIGGSWLARDATTDVTVSDDATTTIYVGWDTSTADTVIVGTASDFGTYDPNIPLYDITAASGSVTGETDRRIVGDTLERDTFSATAVGSTFETIAFTGRNSTSPVGEIDQSNGEIWRAYGSQSDLVMNVQDGDGRMNFCWNAYNDGAWRYMANDVAHRICFESTGDIELYTAPSGTADAEITWTEFTFAEGGDISVGGTTVWDESENEVPRARLGGAASSLSAYPIPASDIDDGPGSGLDADTVDGIEAAAITGQWEELDTFTDTDDTTALEYDSDAEGVTLDHDRIRLEIYRECTAETSANYQSVRINGISTTSYRFDFFDANQNTHTSLDNQTGFGRIAGTNHIDTGDIAMQVVELACPAETRSVGKHYAVCSTPTPGVIKNVDYLVSGMCRTDITGIDRVELYGGGDATGKVRVIGRDVF